MTEKAKSKVDRLKFMNRKTEEQPAQARQPPATGLFASIQTFVESMPQTAEMKVCSGAYDANSDRPEEPTRY